MPDTNHENRQLIIVNFVHHAVIANTNSPFLTADQTPSRRQKTSIGIITSK